ncbi:MAG: TIGR01212 family radical SAM protein [Clostridia bacterium]|jgi:radical SAM protein (TIGR01212 family)|nr:TIGR01212 family radical SAM protein [Clostridia bacterium]
MENEERYKHLNKYLKEKFGERTLKICIDGGFTCPNRDGTISTGGCIFCSEKGSGELINYNEKISKQISQYFLSYRSERANKFIAYFQNFTNTYDTLENLKAKYDAALIDDRIVGLEISTRPDCINEEIVKLLRSYTDRYYVCVELGLQTSNENTGNLINRGYTNQQFTNAVSLLNKYNIDVVAHIMIGLPNESFDDIKNTVDFINKHNIQGIKIHSTYVVKNTVLADMYFDGSYVPISLEYYLNDLTYIITHISSDVVIHRISGDAPKHLLIAPEWNLHKKWVLNGFEKILREQDLWQGKYYKNQ